MGKMQREKGKEGEREVAKISAEAGFSNSKRGVQYKGSPGSPDVVGIPGVHLEVKRVEKLHLWPAYDQACNDAGEAEYPVVVHRSNRKPWVAILSYQDFLEIYKGYLESLNM